MDSQLALIHRPKEAGAFSFESGSGVSTWNTCLRYIAVGSIDSIKALPIDSHDQLHVGRKAYVFLLEVVCGLHSPVQGETEVHGQYRDFLESIKPNIERSFFDLLTGVHIHAKKVRTQHLRGLGSQSYGSYCRRKVRGLPEVHLVGSGHMVSELLPWLTKLDVPVKVHCRNAEAKKEIYLKRYRNLEVCELFSGNALRGAFILAAPVQSQLVQSWLGESRADLSLILDLRAESAGDPLETEVTLENLKAIFSAIENSRVRIGEDLVKARHLINELADENSYFGAKKRSGSAAGLYSRSSAPKVPERA